MDIYELSGASTETITMAVSAISAGMPLEVANEVIKVDPTQLLTRGSRNCLLIKVAGDSMCEQVPDGSWAVIDRDRVPVNGDIVLALLGSNEYTIKQFKDERKGKQGLWLVPMHEDYQPREIGPDDAFVVVGVAIMVLQSLV